MNLKQRVQEWLEEPFDSDTHREVEDLKRKATDLEDAFYTDISFGTGGMRGKMGVGPNRINKFTLGKASQGLANYLKHEYGKKKSKENMKIVIAYDSRHNSKMFAQMISSVFTANGFLTYVFEDLRPTPLLSFAVRFLKADAGIVLTASHNPPVYNGYKVYNKHGGQIAPPEDKEIIRWINETKFEDIQWKGSSQLLILIGQEIDQAYEKETLQQRIISPTSTEKSKIVFSPLHGTAIKNIPQLLKKAGYNNCAVVASQSHPDGNFPTVKSPNPEEPEAFELAIKQGNKENANLIMATDPDADRIGICVRNQQSEWQLLNGNQLMTVLIRFVIENKPFHENAFIASTIVSTPLVQKIAAAHGIECKLTLTGFKWIGKLIQDFPHQNFLCGGEESYGFLFGDAVRDKDAVSTALLIADINTYLEEKGKSVYQYLLETYQKFGCYYESLDTMTKEGKKGQEQIKTMMSELRKNPPKMLDNTLVVNFEDYSIGKKQTHLGKIETIHLPKADVLIIHLEDGRRIAIRPSGTEPKIKFYFSANTSLVTIEDYPDQQQKLKMAIQKLRENIYALL